MNKIKITTFVFKYFTFLKTNKNKHNNKKRKTTINTFSNFGIQRVERTMIEQR